MDSSMADYIHRAFHYSSDIDWQAEALDRARLLTYSGMHAFVFFMIGFFFLFLYYCAFGFIVGAISESSMEGQEIKAIEATGKEDQAVTQTDGTRKKDAEKPITQDAATDGSKGTGVKTQEADPDMGFGLFK